MDETRDLKVRQAFQVLTQGVELVHYDGRNSSRASSEKLLWLDPDILRICVDISRPNQRQRAKGKVSPGLYLRDIGEVRAGSRAFDFQQSSYYSPKEAESEQCMSLIGTERTLCLLLKSKTARDWFVERLKLVIDDVLTETEKRNRLEMRSGHLSLTLNPTDTVSPADLRNLFARGFKVLHHHPNDTIIESIIYFDQTRSRVVIRPVVRSFFSFSDQSMGLQVEDIVEIRQGTHSLGFVGSDSMHKQAECLSIVGTEATLDIELASGQARDLLAQKLRSFRDSFIASLVEDDGEDGDRAFFA